MFRTTALTLTAAAVLSLTGAAEAAILAEYTFDGNSVASTDLDTDSTASDFTQSAALTQNGFVSSEVRAFKGDIQGGGTGNVTLSQVIAEGAYFEFTLTADGANVLDLDTLTFRSNRPGSSPDDISVTTDIDGHTAGDAILTNANINSPTNKSVNLSGAQYQGIASVTFRFYVHGNNARNPTIDTGRYGEFDNVRINGEVVPEPASLALLALGGLCMIPRRR